MSSDPPPRGTWQILTRADWALIALLAALIAGLLLHQGRAGAGAAVVVEVDGQPPRSWPLSPPRTLRLAGPLGESRVEISGQGARFLASPCPEQRCVRQGWISREGEMAACLPNRISLRIAGQGGMDALSR